MPRPLSPGRSLLRLLDQSSQPIYALDAGRRIVFANAALGKWLGRESNSLIGLRCDYHAGGGEQPSSEVGAGLCPPPEAFLGTVDRGVVGRLSAADSVNGLPLNQRAARFAWLAGESEGQGLLLVFLQSAGTAESAPEMEARDAANRLHLQLQRLRGQMSRRYRISQLIGQTGVMARVRDQVQIAAAAGANVLIVGPGGSGREHVARTIHYAQSGTPVGPLAPVACSLVDAEAMQSTLTSLLRSKQEKPAAGPPAALLVDVDRLRLDAQQELLGFLKLPELALRTLATSRRPLERLVAKGRFLGDLALAINILTIVLPPLARRKADIPLLAQHFLETTNATGGRQLAGFTSEALELLNTHSWPGNLDELESTVTRACERAGGPRVQAADLPDDFHLALDSAAHPHRALEEIRLDDFLADVERQLLERALRAARGNKSRAAAILGLSRQRLLRRLAHFGLIPPVLVEEEPVVFEPVDELAAHDANVDVATES